MVQPSHFLPRISGRADQQRITCSGKPLLKDGILLASCLTTNMPECGRSDENRPSETKRYDMSPYVSTYYHCNSRKKGAAEKEALQ